MARTLITLTCLTLLLAGCGSPAPEMVTTANKQTGQLRAKMENRIVETVVDQAIKDVAAISPELATRIGHSRTNTRWDPVNVSVIKAVAIGANADLLRDSVDSSLLTRANEARRSLLLFGDAAIKRLALHASSVSRVDHINGPQVALPDFLINFQPARTADDFEDYIVRMSKFSALVEALIAREPGFTSETGSSIGVLVAAQCQQLMQGAPFEIGDASPLLADFTDRIQAAGVPRQVRAKLLQQFSKTLQAELTAGCDRLNDYFRSSAPIVTTLVTPDYYLARLFAVTSVDSDPGAIHEQAMTAASEATTRLDVALSDAGLSRADLSSDPHYRIATDADSKQSLLNAVSNVIFNVDPGLRTITAQAPTADLEVRMLPDFEQAAPALSRYLPPSAANYFGIVYVNPAHLRSPMLASLAYAHSIPGAHLIASTELATVIPVPAFTEGWAMYAADLPYELGLDTDPLSRIGREALSAYSAATCAVDTGIHTGIWQTNDATAYLLRMLPILPAEADAMVLAIKLDPARVCAGFIGATAIRGLRRDAEIDLKDRFRLQEFHDAVLAEGAVPLPTAAKQVSGWVRQKRRFE